MNPYANLSFPRPSDLAVPTPDDITSSPPASAPPHYSTLVPTEQLQQTDQPELCNPYADVLTSSVPVLNENAVRSESLSINADADHFPSADRTDQSDVSNPQGLSIVTEQFEAEAQFTSQDLECAICFSQFNNAYRCPKRLQCGHTFCLECLARMNVKSPEPSAVLCPLCRALTALPALGLPKLSTDPQVLSRLPSSMQRVYSVRFLRNKGRLQLKRPDASLLTRSTRRSLDVGLPSPVPRGMTGSGARTQERRALFRLTDRPACRVLIFMAAIMVIIILTATVVYLLVTNQDRTP
uniref:RING-type domain-containing protein n=1 Tax=Neogobius melanostomus TaxID=47308 RepID=A0A8C6S847_9GOBI